MAGNEMAIADFLFNNIGKATLNHLGLIKEIGAPDKSLNKYKAINNAEALKLISTQDSKKKADIYINGVGVSLKQTGPSFPYNRLQRADVLNLFNFLKLNNPEEILNKIDTEVDNFHVEKTSGRSRPWNTVFSETDFKKLVKYLMMEGSPKKQSNHPADFILEASKVISKAEDITVYTFDEYFDKYKDSIFLGVRRQWIGQGSKFEHRRAFGLKKKPENLKWVYDDVKGSPNPSKSTGFIWNPLWPEKDRKTVYMIFIEKI
ncbi:MAG: hypothetical protein JNM14_16685 [Ferruginibacter sp.]|nr:hypothetical protein [Ferruginibacter sp.]